MLQFKEVVKFYGKPSKPKHILKKQSFNIPLDENIALLGKNGIGKSTILRMIAGCESISSGEVINPHNTSWPLALQGGIQASLTARENARIIAIFYGIDDVIGYVEAVKEFSELGEDFERLVGNYSNGMRSRLAFALSIHIDFDVYLIDEIISVGDENFRLKANKVIESMLNEKTFIIVSHNKALLKKHCKRAVVLDENKLELFNTIEEGLERYEAIC